MPSVKSVLVRATLLLFAVDSAAQQPLSVYPPGLLVDRAPNELRPYVLPKNSGQPIRTLNDISRLAVTGNSSAGSFTVMQVASLQQDAPSVAPHLHKRHYENFYCNKGRVQLWSQLNGTDNVKQTRILQPGDFGAVAHNHIHAFHMLEPDTVFTVVIQPGGFEQFLIDIADDMYESEIGSAFRPIKESPRPFPALDVAIQDRYDSWPIGGHVLRDDAVDGIAGFGNWHNGSNELATDSKTAFYIAKNWGPKYLNSEGGAYKIIAPLTTAATSAGNLTMGSITMSPLLTNLTASEVTLPDHTTMLAEEGRLVIRIQNETAVLADGDIVFIPGGTTFSYWALAAATKFMYIGAGPDGLASRLIENSIPWEFASYPQYSP
ncbi:hypothetical protein CUC08_Gglean013382 [Alternaria sp. MG1]|nr:hypothetical protein CUC08_Gglean013382 [Alternaria sp. MG1]